MRGQTLAKQEIQAEVQVKKGGVDRDPNELQEPQMY